MGFGEKWCSWMYQCMSTASISVLLNGTPTDRIRTEKGLGQGCSLSPLLFNLGGELLHLLLTKAVDMGLFSGFELGVQESSFKLSHLQFADDLIILSKASIRDLKNIRRVLLIYEILEVLAGWSNEIGCSVGNFPTEYLGLPLGSKRNSVAMWESIVQRFHNKLTGWKNSKSFVAEIKFNHGCIFMGGSTDRRNIHWVIWNLVNKLRRLRGLGILNLDILNRALMGKWVWKFVSEKDSWWKRVVCCVNNLDLNSKMLGNTSTARPSWIWRCVINNFFSSDEFRDCIRRNLRLKAGNGHSVEFWHDIWLGEVPLKDLFPRFFDVVRIPFDSLVGDLTLADSIGRHEKSGSKPTCWVPPPDGFVKINVDGAIESGWNKGGIGGLIRDSRGVLIHWFSDKVGGRPPIMAELLAIKRGLYMLSDSGIGLNMRIILESDSSNAL
ncbi:uncharacterized protein LOC120201411 [Hibiscus syriacus]|uniref:uncharacterized protein LOC120201411 n=1 Tax=Hibiscus syriacus TaxID=106335 RepID=UPI0019228949|nr:uncharacterized protein LOC120201411 [Hibiscus syriacus]